MGSKILAIHYMGLNFLSPSLVTVGFSPFHRMKTSAPTMWTNGENMALIATDSSLVAIPSRGGAKEVNIETGPSTLVLVGETPDHRVTVECVSSDSVPVDLHEFRSIGSETFSNFKALFEVNHVPERVRAALLLPLNDQGTMMEIQGLYRDVCIKSTDLIKMQELTFVNACIDLANRYDSVLPIQYAKYTLRAPYVTGKYDKFQMEKILDFLKQELRKVGIEAPKLA